MTIRRFAATTLALLALSPFAVGGTAGAAPYTPGPNLPIPIDFPIQWQYSCGGQTATIVGTSAGDVINGTSGADVIVSLGGNDTVNGNGGDDKICSGSGNDMVNGGGGFDLVRGGNDGDTLVGGDWDDQLLGEAGADVLIGYQGADYMDGGPGNDSLDAVTGDNHWIDAVYGGTGDDLIMTNDGTGNDLGFDGGGADVCQKDAGDNITGC